MTDLRHFLSHPAPAPGTAAAGLGGMLDEQRRDIAAALRQPPVVDTLVRLSLAAVPPVLRPFVGGVVERAVRRAIAGAADWIDPDRANPTA